MQKKLTIEGYYKKTIIFSFLDVFFGTPGISFGTPLVVELETIRANFHDSIIKTFIIRADATQNNKIQSKRPCYSEIFR